jgi:hypothetical protein
MENQPIHMLEKHGVLINFSISKKITEEYVDKIILQKKYKNHTPKQIAEIIKNKITNEIKQVITKRKIPGLIYSNEELIKFNKLNVLELNTISSIVLKKLMDINYSKMELCHFINTLINFLELTDDDFNVFYKNIEGSGEDSLDDDE